MELEISRMKHDAEGRLDGNPQSVGDRVTDGNERDLEDAKRDRFSRFDLHQPRLVSRRGLQHLPLDHPQSKFGAVHGNVEFGQHERQRADMVLMAMGDQDAADFFSILFKIGDIGNDKVDAQHLLIGKHQAGIDHHNVIFVFYGVHILADFPQPAQGNKLQRFSRRRGDFSSVGIGGA